MGLENFILLLARYKMAYKPKLKDKEQTKVFVDKVFLRCGYCGYNNERKRLQHFKGCLKCHRPLGDDLQR